MSPDPLCDRLRGIVGVEHVLTDPDLCAAYETDWTGRYHGRARCVVRPQDTAQVAAVLAGCAGAGAAVVPQGGNTGLVGGSVPRGGEVVLSLRRLAELGAVDPLAAQVTVGAGASLADVQRHARASGLDVGMDFAARDSATIGGLVATNAGGERVLRHGVMRRQVAGVEAVLADGSVLRRLSGLPKDNVGYDMVGLLAGSEGTLAVLTAVRLHLVARPAHRTVVLLGVATMAAVVRVLAMARDRIPGLEAAEFFLAGGLELVCAHRRLPPPLAASYPAYLLLEATGSSDPTDAMAAALADADDVTDVAVGTSAADRDGLWVYREAHTESISALGVPVKLDVAVPVPLLARFVEQISAVVTAVEPAARTVLFGHVAEGNVHVNVVGAADSDAVADAVLQRVAADGGSISAEHGVGMAKTRWVGLSRSPVDLELMRAMKHAWDPGGRLNPGVVFGA